MKPAEQRANETFILRFWREPRGTAGDPPEWRVRLEHVESHEQFHGRTFEQIRAVFERYGFTDRAQSAPTFLRRVANNFRHRLRSLR